MMRALCPWSLFSPLVSRVRLSLGHLRTVRRLSTGTGRIYLDVPYGEKERAKSRGARWDAAAKRWYIRPRNSKYTFAQWQMLYLRVPDEQQQTVERLGARWDRAACQWYVTASTRDPFAHWLEGQDTVWTYDAQAEAKAAALRLKRQQAYRQKKRDLREKMYEGEECEDGFDGGWGVRGVRNRYNALPPHAERSLGVLGLPSGTPSRGALKAAYCAAMLLHHPDKHQQQSPAKKRTAAARFTQSREAYETLQAFVEE
ncbi:hypothetical protein B484DRAFT_39027 [Ochromonadaceae sp. CCMP2298]|nr:hypothetical protein B484DRAFT_39027 [Ochromonadaceae sp. CCMP2298]